MSLTHYWLRPSELPANSFRAASEDCRVMFTDADLAGFDGTGQPICNEQQVVFNGRYPAVCEPFEMACVEFDRQGRSQVRSFCKTDQMPYDLYVKVALIIMHHHLRPHLSVTSDAPDTEWIDAVALVVKNLRFGHEFTLAVK